MGLVCIESLGVGTDMQNKGWLGHRIKEAQKEIEEWPDWMKATTTFEGAVREKPNEVRSEPIKESKNASK